MISVEAEETSKRRKLLSTIGRMPDFKFKNVYMRDKVRGQALQAPSTKIINSSHITLIMSTPYP